MAIKHRMSFILTLSLLNKNKEGVLYLTKDIFFILFILSDRF